MAIVLFITDDAMYWYRNGLRHNKYKPAVEYPNGNIYWYKDGELHRLYGPAVEYPNGDKFWFINDIEYSYLEYIIKLNNSILTLNTNKKHMGIELCISKYGNKRWYKNRNAHKLSGPAIEYANGKKEWCINGVHRTYLEYIVEVEQYNAKI